MSIPDISHLQEQVEVFDDDAASVDDSVGESVEESVADSEDNHG